MLYGQVFVLYAVQHIWTVKAKKERVPAWGTRSLGWFVFSLEHVF